jgi:penicillin-binding protein 1B
MYANQINLGQRGSFSIDGFGEASQAYFGKDVRQLDLAECALLAGIIQRPNYFNPFRHPDRTIERRNLVLDSMVETGAITKEQAERQGRAAASGPAAWTPAKRPTSSIWCTSSLLQKLGERDFNREGLRIYTSLDPDLQREATAAVESTIHVWTSRWTSCTRQKAGQDLHLSAGGAGGAQSPHRPGAGAGGRAQLRQLAVESRGGQAAHRLHLQAVRLRRGLCNTAVEGTMLPGKPSSSRPLTMLNDEQTTYDVGGQEYTPRNFEGEYHGQVTARYALQRR